MNRNAVRVGGLLRSRGPLAVLSACLATLLTAGCAAPRWSVRGGALRDRQTPVLPLELYTVKTDSDYEIARFMGFDAVCDDGPLVAPLVTKHGMVLTLPNWFDVETLDTYVERKVRRFAPYEQIAAWNLADEPDLRPEASPPQVLAHFARVIRREDPTRLVSVTLSGRGDAWKRWDDYAGPVDVLRLDPYPVAEEASFDTMRERIAHAKALAGDTKSVWVILQAWQGGGARLPTPEELRLSAYLALMGGAQGLSVFDFNLDTWMGDPAFFEALLRTVAEARWLRGMRRGRTAESDGTLSCRWTGAGARVDAEAAPAERRLAARRTASRGGSGPLDVAEESGPFDPDQTLYRLSAPDSPRRLYRNAGNEPATVHVRDAKTPLYLCDLHGHRWTRLAPDGEGKLLIPPHATVEAVGPKTPFASKAEAAFVDKGLSVSIQGGAPRHGTFENTLRRHTLRPGRPLAFTVTIAGARAVGLDAALYHYDHLIPGAASVKRLPSEAQDRSEFLVTVRLPADASDDVGKHVDLTLHLGIAWADGAVLSRVERTIRVRREKPLPATAESS